MNNYSYVVQVFLSHGAGKGSSASGCWVGDGLVLTTGHLKEPFLEIGDKVSVSLHNDLVEERAWYSGIVEWVGADTDSEDAALIRVEGVKNDSFALISDPCKDQAVEVIGWPMITTKEEFRNAGYTIFRSPGKVVQSDTHTLRALFESVPTKKSDWKGISGAPILDGIYIVGIIRRYHEKLESKNLNCVGINQLLKNQRFSEIVKAHTRSFSSSRRADLIGKLVEKFNSTGGVKKVVRHRFPDGLNEPEQYFARLSYGEAVSLLGNLSQDEEMKTSNTVQDFYKCLVYWITVRYENRLSWSDRGNLFPVCRIGYAEVVSDSLSKNSTLVGLLCIEDKALNHNGTADVYLQEFLGRILDKHFENPELTSLSDQMEELAEALLARRFGNLNRVYYAILPDDFEDLQDKVQTEVVTKLRAICVMSENRVIFFKKQNRSSLGSENNTRERDILNSFKNIEWLT